MNEGTTITARDVWTRSWRVVSATRRTTIAIILGGLVVPQFLWGLWFDLDSATVVDELRRLSTLNSGGPERFEALIFPVLAWSGRLSAYLGGLLIMYLTCYFGLVHVAVSHLRGSPTPTTGEALLAGLKHTLPRGIILVGTLILLLAIGQILIAPAILIAILSLAVPVILVAERKGVARALIEALTLKWARRTGVSGWAVLFHMMVLGATAYSGLAVIGLLTMYGIELDRFLGIPRTFWSMTLDHQPFGPAYLSASLAESVLSMGVIGILPALTATLYFAVASRREFTRV